MKSSDFHAPDAGRIYRSMDGIDTFVPAPLPPSLTYSDQFVISLSHADAALSELSGVGRQLPNPHLLINPYLHQEAVLSSRIEGTRASLSDVLLDDIDVREAIESGEADVQEVRNYVIALEYGIDRVRTGHPVTLNMIRSIHERLMFGVRGELSSPGRFRAIQNWIGPVSSTVENAAYVPPPPELLQRCLDDWERFWHTTGLMPDLVQCAILHEQFEAIHPFIDGNGRMGRLLITLFLIERDRLSQPLLYLSQYIEARRQEYYDLLQRVRTYGDWLSWILFFLDGVEQTARAAITQTRRLVDMREDFRARTSDKPRALALIDQLFVNPYTTVARARQQLAVSDPTARAAIGILEERNILQEVSGRSWRRLYLCKPILQAISGGEPTNQRECRRARGHEMMKPM